jgi:hypothetical protein
LPPCNVSLTERATVFSRDKTRGGFDFWLELNN